MRRTLGSASSSSCIKQKGSSTMSTGVRDRREDLSSPYRTQPLEVDEEQQIDQSPVSNDEDVAPPSPSKEHVSSALNVVYLLRYLLLLLANIIAWYITNGMNGIAMQSFTSHVRDFRAGKEFLVSNIALQLLVTATQLAFGVCMGMTMLWVFSLMKSQQTRSFKFGMAKQDVVLGSLHGIGSLCTNLGFSYGSASLIQILKLLEPFETIILSQALMPDEAKITTGVVSSMIFVVGAAVSLIRIRPTPPHPHAVVFAIFSGLTLSSRNVLQRKQHVQADDEDRNNKKTSKIERSIDQFTKLSYNSAVVTFSLAIPLNLLLLTTSPTHAIIVRRIIVEALNWKVLTWHPLYNAFSVITLGFCSALTHSLLNAGKRVFAIVMAIVWFREDFTMATLLGLLAVGAGGCWYTVETKAKVKDSGGRVGKWIKLAASIALLQTLLRLQGMITREG